MQFQAYMAMCALLDPTLIPLFRWEEENERERKNHALSICIYGETAVSRTSSYDQRRFHQRASPSWPYQRRCQAQPFDFPRIRGWGRQIPGKIGARKRPRRIQRRPGRQAKLLKSRPLRLRCVGGIIMQARSALLFCKDALALCVCFFASNKLKTNKRELKAKNACTQMSGKIWCKCKQFQTKQCKLTLKTENNMQIKFDEPFCEFFTSDHLC